MLLVAFGFTVMSHEFLAPDNIRSIVFLNTDLAVVVLGLAFIMAGGGFDLSVGYQISLISALISVMIVAGISPVFIVIAALLTGIGCGLLNGILTAYLNIVPFAATLATQVIFRGISYYISDNRISWAPNTLQAARIVIKLDMYSHMTNPASGYSPRCFSA